MDNMQVQSFFQQLGKPLQKRKGDLLFRQGDHDASIYAVSSGLLKAYYLTLDGKELIKSFITEGEFIGSLIACQSGEPCTFNLMCLEDCLLFKAPFADVQTAMEGNKDVSSILTRSLISLAIKKERREYEFLCLSATDRYRLLIKKSPELLDRLTQNDIARYLGITPVALSRIKQRVNTEN